MRNLFHRLFGRPGTRAFDAAGGGRRWEGQRTVDGLNTAILAGASTAARRAGWYARNNPWVSAAVDSLVGNVVGAGIKPQSTHPDRAVRERLQVLWLRWTDHADPGGLADFYGLQAMAVRAMVEGGESFARLRVVPDSSAVPLHIDLLDRDQVPLDLHRDIGGGARIRAGIEFNGAGQRTAYWVMRDRPDDPLTSLRLEPLRIPATDCLHLFKPLSAGQLRGITWLAPVLLRLHELDQFEDAALVKAKVAALFTGFITNPDGTAGGLTGTNTNGALTVGMEPGSLIPLPPGTDIHFSNPTESDAYGPFVKTLLTRRADLAPASADRDARTVEVIWSTGSPVRRRDMAGQYVERLSLAPEAVDLSRLQGASVLDAHRQSAVRDVLGSVQTASVDGQRGTALIRFSARPEVEPLWQDVLSGILRHVSVGYSVEEWAETTENGARVLTASRWTPHEISLVPTPADPGARIRMEAHMPDTITPTPPEAQTRAAINTEIRSIARIAGLDQSWIDGQIDATADADTARRAAFDALASRSAPTIRTEQVRAEMGESQDDPSLRARQMGEALYARINPRHELTEPARRYAYATPVDMAKELLTLRGESTLALSPASLVTRALHTTSDFPIILGNTVGRVLRDAYAGGRSAAFR